MIPQPPYSCLSPPLSPPITAAKVNRQPERGSDLRHPVLMRRSRGGSRERRGGWHGASLHELSRQTSRSQEHSASEPPSQGASVDATTPACPQRAWQHRLFHHLAVGSISSQVVTRAVAPPGLLCNAPQVCYQPEEDECGHTILS